MNVQYARNDPIALSVIEPNERDRIRMDDEGGRIIRAGREFLGVLKVVPRLHNSSAKPSSQCSCTAKR
jgi:hypothetical protein